MATYQPYQNPGRWVAGMIPPEPTKDQQQAGQLGIGQTLGSPFTNGYGGSGQSLWGQNSQQAAPWRPPVQDENRPQQPAQQPSQFAYQPSAMPAWNGGATPQANFTAGSAFAPTSYATLPTQNTAEWWNSQTNRNNVNSQLSAMLPLWQFQQNNTQYANDFNEAQRRWDAEMQWRQAQDQYNMGLAGRQQGMAEWQAGENARQWGAQFGWQQETDKWNRSLAQQAADTEQAYRQGLISNSQREIALAELTQRQNNTLAQQAANTEQAYRQGLISNSQRELALAELTQQQGNTLGQQNLAWQQELGRGQLSQSREELLQRAALEREQMANAQRIAALQATGRWQQPNIRWMRNY